MAESALGATISELNIQSARVNVPKTQFSMLVPEVSAALPANLASVVIFGIEVT
jgi:hypothetical protein